MCVMVFYALCMMFKSEEDLMKYLFTIIIVFIIYVIGNSVYLQVMKESAKTDRITCQQKSIMLPIN